MVALITAVVGALTLIVSAYLRYKESSSSAQASIDAAKVKKMEEAENVKTQERLEEFNAKADAVVTADAAARLLAEAARRSPRPR